MEIWAHSWYVLSQPEGSTILTITVFTSIAAIWAQVEYRSKQLMPWNALQRAPQHCETSLLLDYVDPMNVVSLFKSIRKSHLFVSVAITGALIVQLMVVLSSGLFEAINVMVIKEDASLRAAEAFTGQYNDTITSRPASIIFGNLLYNLSYPLGTTQDYAYQLFDSSQCEFISENSPFLCSDTHLSCVSIC